MLQPSTFQADFDRALRNTGVPLRLFVTYKVKGKSTADDEPDKSKNKSDAKNQLRYSGPMAHIPQGF